jgi:hypothetical protein
VDVGGVRVGLLAWTTVDGDFVNDSYPDEDAAAPADPSEPWLWERRAWGFDGPTWSVPTAERRIGGAWRLFDAVEDELPAEERAAAWASLAAVYPELQDWVARRGHGGAASFSSARAMADIAALDAEADLVVVQLHSGFQFQTAPSAWVREVVRRCAEAGADVVIAHHPHVLQGVERVGGALVVYSLGNLVFDQDFLATFPTAFLRLVYDGDALLEARLIPLELAGYRPVPVADRGAARTVRSLWELSQLRAESDRVDGAVRTFAVGLPPGTEPLHLALERHGAVVRDAPPVAEGIELRVGRGAIVDLGVDGLVDPRLGLAPGSADGIEVGRDLFGWGHFEDVLADGLHAPGTHWSVDSEWESIEVGDTPDGLRFLRLVRSENSGADVLVRPLARTPLPRHRLWSGAAPLDPEPRYAVRFLARLTGRAPAELRLRLYHFDDTNPSEDPSSVATADVAVPLTLRGGWEEVVVDVDPAWMVDGALTANMLLPTLALGPSESPEASLDIDAFQVLELRRADAMPDRMGAWDVVHNGGDRAVRLAVPTWPLRAPR